MPAPPFLPRGAAIRSGRTMQSRRTQRATRLAALAAAGLTSALYAQSVGLKPGLYEFTTEIQLPPDLVAKMPPQALAMMQKPNVRQQCISQGDVDHVSEQLSQGHANQPQNCKVLEHSVSGGDVKFTTQCEHNTAHFEGSFTGDSFQGTVVSTSDKGQTSTVKISARRVGDCSK
jgi:hypothetical protein